MAKGNKMAGGEGMSPRKAMASDGGNFGVESFYEANCGSGHTPHPDAVARTGAKGHMGDGERAIPEGGVKHHAHSLPAQAAPSHGHTHPNGHGMKHYG